jgi:glycosyltransferase involved in cell wall biosynthesis
VNGSVSIVIATRDRSGLLERALEALLRQTWPSDRLEIIVADNCSKDGTRAVVAQAAANSNGIRVRYLYVAQPGKSHAVNAALRLTRGELIALTDDDVEPDREWIAALWHAVEDTDSDFVAGRIYPLWEIEPPAWISSAVYGALAVPDNGDVRLPITADGSMAVMPIGANMAVRATTITRVGGLRTDLGKLAGSLRTGEDHEFFLRMLRAGCRGVYEPKAVVGHFVPADRLVRRYCRRWLYQNGCDVARIERVHARVPFLLGVPRHHWRGLISEVARSARATVSRDEARRFASVVRMLWFAGYFREAWFGGTRSAAGAFNLAIDSARGR